MDWKSLLRGNLNRMADSQHREKKEVNSTIELVIRSEVTCVTVEAELNGICSALWPCPLPGKTRKFVRAGEEIAAEW